MKVAFSPVPDESRGILKAALETARLPIDDLDEPGRRFFQLSDDQGPIGFVGIEGDGADRLVRSLVVLSGRERQGHGGLLVAHVEALARREGAKRLHLLTTTVADFFRSRGYRAADRAHAPAVIAATAQFASLCPGSATYVVKELTRAVLRLAQLDHEALDRGAQRRLARLPSDMDDGREQPEQHLGV